MLLHSKRPALSISESTALRAQGYRSSLARTRMCLHAHQGNVGAQHLAAQKSNRTSPTSSCRLKSYRACLLSL